MTTVLLGSLNNYIIRRFERRTNDSPQIPNAINFSVKRRIFLPRALNIFQKEKHVYNTSYRKHFYFSWINFSTKINSILSP